MYTVSFEGFMLFGLGALASGAIARLIYYLARIEAPRPSPLRYFGLALIVALGCYTVGSFAGIAVMCSPSSGNLCGIWGALGSGPLLGGLSLWLFGPLYRRRMAGPT